MPTAVRLPSQAVRSVQRRPTGSGVVHASGWTARVSPHCGQVGAAQLTPLTLATPSAAQLDAVVTQAAALGFTTVVSPAVAPRDLPPYEAAGFTLIEELYLLRHDLERIDSPAPGIGLRRARRSEWAALVEIDALAFQPFWRLDATGLEEAGSATPVARVRVAAVDGRPAGYAITGRAGASGYVQRLAVTPTCAGRGLGSALLIDGLHWLRARGAHEALVNTQIGNERALVLYLRRGFRLDDLRLAVLRRTVGTAGL